MKRTYTLLSLLLCSVVAQAQWQKTQGPQETNATTIEQYNNELYMGAGSIGLFKSINNATSWTKVGTFPDTAIIKDITKIVDYKDSLFVATYSNIYKSHDDGATWEYAQDGLPDTVYNYNLFKAGTQLCATGEALDISTFTSYTKVYHYADAYDKWFELPNLPADANVSSVAALHDTIYCAVLGHGIYKTSDYGLTWDSTNITNGINTNNVQLLYADGQTMYAVAHDNNSELLWSNDGQSWQSVLVGNGNVVKSIAAQGNTICLGLPGAISISTDGGANWQNVFQPYYSLNQILFSGNRIYGADGTMGVVYTANNANWQTANDGLSYSVNYHLAKPYDKLYAMDYINTFHTADAGNSWLKDTSILWNMGDVCRMGNKLIGFVNNGQQNVQSWDGGDTWRIDTGYGVNMFVAGTIVDNAHRKLYAWGGYDVRRSDDYGQTWKSFFNASGFSNDTLFTSMAMIDNYLFVTLQDPDYKLLYSNDSGEHWHLINTTHQIYRVAAVNNTLVAGTDIGIMTSTNMGSSFTPVNGTDLFHTYVNGDILFSYHGPYPNNVAYSTDYGATWTDISPNADSVQEVNALLMDSNYLYIATTGSGVWKRSLNELGLTYTADTTNNYTVPTAVAMIPAQQNKLTIYPNPFTTGATVALQTEIAHNTDIRLYDETGRCVQVIANGQYGAGVHTYAIKPPLPAGIYFMVARLDGYVITKKIVRQ